MADEPKDIELRWDASEGVPAAACNVFLSQFTHAEFTLTFGYAAPPLPSKEGISAVKVQVVARLSLSPARMGELINVLKGNLETFQQMSIASATADQIKH